MGIEDLFLSGFSGNDLDSFRNTVRENSFARQAAPLAFGWQPDTSTWSKGETLAAAFGKAFLGQALNNMASQDEARQISSLQSALPSLINDPLSTLTPEGVDEEAFSTLRSSASLKNLLRQEALKQEMATTSAKDIQELRKTVIGEIVKNPDDERLLLFGKAMGLPIDVGAFKANEPPLADLRAKKQEDMLLGPDLGIETLADKEKRLFEENRKAGMPKTQAATSAKSTIDDARKRTKDLFGTKLKTLGDNISTVEEIIGVGTKGMADAGRTGSAAASTWEKGLAFLGFPEAEKQSAGDALLTKTQQLGAAMGRIAGSGAMSDFETKALFATALSPNQTNSANEAIMQRYKQGLEIMREHQDFINYVIDTTGGNPEKAQTLWEIYKRENPVINEAGELNTERTPWHKYKFKDAYRRFATGEMSEASMKKQQSSTKSSGSSGGIPTVGGSFNNEKVISVKKIR